MYTPGFETVLVTSEAAATGWIRRPVAPGDADPVSGVSPPTQRMRPRTCLACGDERNMPPTDRRGHSPEGPTRDPRPAAGTGA